MGTVILLVVGAFFAYLIIGFRFNKPEDDLMGGEEYPDE